MSELTYVTNREAIESLASLEEMALVLLRSKLIELSEGAKDMDIEELTRSMEADGTVNLISPEYVKEAWAKIYDKVRHDQEARKPQGPTVVVEINGGVMQDAYSNLDNLKVLLVDWDNIQSGDPAVDFGCLSLDNLNDKAKEELEKEGLL